MPCERGSASAQISRLSQLPYYSALSDEAMTSMIDVLSNHATDAEHARRAISAWLEDSRGDGAKLPTEGDLIALLGATRIDQPERSDAPSPRGYCGLCRRGWVFTQKRTASGEMHDYAGRCRCVGGTATPPPDPQGRLL